MNQAALVVIDMQNDFCLPDSRLFVARAPEIIGNVARLMEAFRAEGAPVVVVLRQHRLAGCDVDRSRLGIFGDDPFLVDSPGADLVDGLQICQTDVIVVKRRWSAFFATDLDIVLRRLGVTIVVLAGVQTPNCIRATLTDASSLDYGCVVVRDATASATTEIQQANLYDMALMGAQILTCDQVSENYLMPRSELVLG